MTDTDTPILAPADGPAPQRRRFLQLAGGATLAAGLAACGGSNGSSSPTPTPTPSSTVTPTPTPSSTVALDTDYLNFALQLEYLEAQYFAYATTGSGIAAALLAGSGTAGTAAGGGAVSFTDPLVGQYAREIAAEDLAHVGFLRSMIGAANTAAQPAIDLSSAATGGFTKLARNAGVVGSGATFDPYASDLNFLLGAFVLKDVVVTAYRSLIPLLANPLYINAMADMLATESFHAAMIRTRLYALGSAARTATDQFSAARDALDGPADRDQGVTGDSTAANITPADGNGIIYGRTAGQVLNILYVDHTAVVGGGFYPAGLNGRFLITSDAN